MNQKNWDLELSHYIKVGEPNKAFKAKTWETAIGLQDKNRINQYYKVLDNRKKEVKEEWVLKGDTVIDASYETIMDSL